MKRKIFKTALAYMLILLILCGCRSNRSEDYREYEIKKYECFQHLIDNEKAIDSIIEELEEYDVAILFYYEDNAIKLAGDATDEQRKELFLNDKLMSDLHCLFENEYINCLEKIKFKNKTEYEYIIPIDTILEGYFSSAYLANNSIEISQYDEHIMGEWFYNIHPILYV